MGHSVALEEISNTRREVTLPDAIAQAEEALKAEAELDPAALLAIAQACYRLGQFDLCTQLLPKLSDPAARDYLSALIAWEQGNAQADFARAGLDSYICGQFRLISMGIRMQPRVVGSVIGGPATCCVPGPVARLVAARRRCGGITISRASCLIEALHVAGLLGDQQAAQQALQMQRHNPEASKHIKQFEAVLQQGVWQHLPRYQPTMP